MARKAREKSEIGIYMVQLRGSDYVTFDQTDKINFLTKLQSDNVLLLGYTLLNNSFFCVIKEDYRPLDAILRGASIDFAKKYNKLHNRSGKVFAGRFTSFAAHSMSEVWELISNVHSASRLSIDALTSCEDYFDNQYVFSDFAASYFPNHEDFLSLCNGLQLSDQKIKMSDDEVANYIIQTFQIQPQNLATLPKSLIEIVLTQVFKVTKASVRQVARVSSLSLRMLWNLAKKLKPKKKEKENKDIVVKHESKN